MMLESDSLDEDWLAVPELLSDCESTVESELLDELDCAFDDEFEFPALLFEEPETDRPMPPVSELNESLSRRSLSESWFEADDWLDCDVSEWLLLESLSFEKLESDWSERDSSES